MKKYLLFAWDRYYPTGGMNDLDSHHDSLRDVEVRVQSIRDRDLYTLGSYQIVDRDTLQVLEYMSL